LALEQIPFVNLSLGVLAEPMSHLRVLSKREDMPRKRRRIQVRRDQSATTVRELRAAAGTLEAHEGQRQLCRLQHHQRERILTRCQREDVHRGKEVHRPRGVFDDRDSLIQPACA
jgi:hypothetical protein